MPFSKYRSVEEMPRPERVSDEQLADRIRALWKRARRFAPPATIIRGVQRFRGVEELDAATDRETVQRMRDSREP